MFVRSEEVVMAGQHYKPGGIADRGEAIFRDRILPHVGPLEKGIFVVIDVETGDYEIARADVVATKRLLDRKPNAVTYGVRVGHRAAYSHTGGLRTPPDHD